MTVKLLNIAVSEANKQKTTTSWTCVFNLRRHLNNDRHASYTQRCKHDTGDNDLHSEFGASLLTR